MSPQAQPGRRVLGEWLLTPQRVAIHEPTRTAVIADVHLGYGEARRAAGDAVPLPPPGASLAPLWHAHERFAFRALVVAGDLFERAFAPAAYAALTGGLHRRGVDWLGLVPGNHDRRALARAGDFPVLPDGLLLGAWRVMHGDRDPGRGRFVLGHWHPCVRRRGRKYPCYVVAEDRLVLPAFSPDAAGADVDRDARWRGTERIAIVAGTLT